MVRSFNSSGGKRKTPHHQFSTFIVLSTVAVANMGSLRGPEIFMLDLAGIRAHIKEGRQGVMPVSPLADGVDLFGAPHVYLAMIG